MATQFVRLLGRPEAELDGDRSYFTPGQIAQFLAYLAFRGDWVGREELTYLFWPDQPDSVARRNLRKLLHRARQQMVGIEAEGDRIRWLVGTDLQAWREALTRQDIPEALRLFRGPLMEGLDGGANAEFANWLELERQQITTQLRQAIEARAEQLVGVDPAGAAQLYLQLLEVEPLNEEVVRSCLRSLADAQRFDDLERLYRTFAGHLEAEIGVEPDALTRSLYEALTAAPGDPPTGSEAAGETGAELLPRSPPAEGLPLWGVTAFVGRENELEQLAERLAQALGGRGGAVVVEGEAGVGKTRLIEEFLEQLEGVRVFAGRCYERDLSAPLEPVRAALGAWGREDLPQNHEGVRFWTADPRDRSTIHQGLTARLVAAARQQRGAVLFIDDLQWSDAATLEFLSYAAKRVHDEPVLIVASYRREDRSVLEAWLSHLSERRAIRILGLGRLDPTQTQSMLQGLSGVEPGELARFVEFVHRESEGNPFYLMEYLRWLREADVLELDESQRFVAFSWERMTTVALPEGVRSLIWARYRGLTKDARGALDVAAIIGRTFPFDLLVMASERDPLELWSTFEPLIASGLIVALPDGQYAFSHDKLRQTVYEGIGPPVRRALHALVATALATSGADDAELAHHFLRAEAWPEAYRHLEAAARLAEIDSAWEVALQAYVRVLDLVDRLEDPDRKRFGVLVAVEKLLELMDRRPEWIKTVEQLAALADRLGDSRLVAEAALKRMAVFSILGDHAGATEALEKANAIFASLGDVASEARAYREFAYIAWMRGDYRGVLSASFEALRLFQQLGNRRAEAATAENISHAYRWLGHYQEVVDWGEKAAAIYLELGDRLGDYLRLDTRAWVHMHRGEDEAAAVLIEQLLPICEQMDDKHLVVEKRMNLGKIYLNAAEYREALRNFELAAQVGAVTGDPRHESYPLMSAGVAHERLGEFSEAARTYLRAAQLLEISYSMTRVPDDQIGRADALTLYGSVLRRELEGAEEALASFETAQEIFRRHGDDYRLSKLSMELGALHWHAGRHREASEAYREAIGTAGQIGELEREIAALASLGVVYRELGRMEESIEVSREAIDRLRRSGDLLGEAYVLTSLAATLRKAERSAEARSCLERSLELRRTVGDAEGEAETLRELRQLQETDRSGP